VAVVQGWCLRLVLLRELRGQRRRSVPKRLKVSSSFSPPRYCHLIVNITFVKKFLAILEHKVVVVEALVRLLKECLRIGKGKE